MLITAFQRFVILWQEMFVPGGQMTFERLLHILQGNLRQHREQRADRYHVRQFLVADLFGDLVARHQDDVDVLALCSAVDHGLVDHQRSAFLQRLLTFIEGRQV